MLRGLALDAVRYYPHWGSAHVTTASQPPLSIYTTWESKNKSLGWRPSRAFPRKHLPPRLRSASGGSPVFHSFPFASLAVEDERSTKKSLLVISHSLLFHASRSFGTRGGPAQDGELEECRCPPCFTGPLTGQAQLGNSFRTTAKSTTRRRRRANTLGLHPQPTNSFQLCNGSRFSAVRHRPFLLIFCVVSFFDCGLSQTHSLASRLP